MTAAAIEAQLIDMRNVGTHKSLKLTIHIPEEQALQAIAAFGWPTGVQPVRIAIARLTEEAANVTGPKAPGPPRQQETQPVDGAKTKTAFRDMRPANQAGILCETEAFNRFIAERLKWEGLWPEGKAADYVRRHCNVVSRKDIRPRTPSGDRWSKLVDEYRAWMHHPEMVA